MRAEAIRVVRVNDYADYRGAGAIAILGRRAGQDVSNRRLSFGSLDFDPHRARALREDLNW